MFRGHKMCGFVGDLAVITGRMLTGVRRAFQLIRGDEQLFVRCVGVHVMVPHTVRLIDVLERDGFIGYMMSNWPGGGQAEK